MRPPLTREDPTSHSVSRAISHGSADPAMLDEGTSPETSSVAAGDRTGDPADRQCVGSDDVARPMDVHSEFGPPWMPEPAWCCTCQPAPTPTSINRIRPGRGAFAPRPARSHGGDPGRAPAHVALDHRIRVPRREWSTISDVEHPSVWWLYASYSMAPAGSFLVAARRAAWELLRHDARPVPRRLCWPCKRLRRCSGCVSSPCTGCTKRTSSASRCFSSGCSRGEADGRRPLCASVFDRVQAVDGFPADSPRPPTHAAARPA